MSKVFIKGRYDDDGIYHIGDAPEDDATRRKVRSDLRGTWIITFFFVIVSLYPNSPLGFSIWTYPFWSGLTVAASLVLILNFYSFFVQKWPHRSFLVTREGLTVHPEIGTSQNLLWSTLEKVDPLTIKLMFEGNELVDLSPGYRLGLAQETLDEITTLSGEGSALSIVLRNRHYFDFVFLCYFLSVITLALPIFVVPLVFHLKGVWSLGATSAVCGLLFVVLIGCFRYGYSKLTYFPPAKRLLDKQDNDPVHFVKRMPLRNASNASRGYVDEEGNLWIGFSQEDDIKNSKSLIIMAWFGVITLSVALFLLIPPQLLDLGMNAWVHPALNIFVVFTALFGANMLLNLWCRKRINQRFFVSKSGMTVSSREDDSKFYRWGDLESADLFTQILTFSGGRTVKLWTRDCLPIERDVNEEISRLSGTDTPISRALPNKHRLLRFLGIWRLLCAVIAWAFIWPLLIVIVARLRDNFSTRENYALFGLATFLAFYLWSYSRNTFYRIPWIKRFLNRP